jgi:tetratricopeptide (TPR) repeat protein
MPLDLYGPCPCGSGKKFKWCCAPIHVQIDKALRLDDDGQHEAALRLMDEVTSEHAGNPEAWGRKAQLLFQNDRVDDAEAALQKAFEVNPNYPFGYFLKAMFRQHEGEEQGALLLFRKAADAYDPAAADVLAQVYASIGKLELNLNRPVAAHAALRMAMRLRHDDSIRQALEDLFGPGANLPESAKRIYEFQPCPAGAPAEQRSAWDAALSGAATGKLDPVAKAFERLTEAHADNRAAWFNLGLVRAWLGDNAQAIAALDRYVQLEPDESQAAGAWALAEVLRYGAGMEAEADVIEHNAVYQVRQGPGFVQVLEQLDSEGLLANVETNRQQSAMTGIVLDRGSVITSGTGTGSPGTFGAYFAVMGAIVRLWAINSEALSRVRQDIERRAGSALSAGQTFIKFAEIGQLIPPTVFVSGGSQEEAMKALQESGQSFLEEQWTHRSLKSLGGATPIDAAGHGILRKKLLGLLQFIQECLTKMPVGYDFERLRRKLGIGSPGAPVAEAATLAIDAMGASELSALRSEALTDEQLDSAYRTAQKLDAHELGVNFAKALIARPASAERPDRYLAFNYLIQRALAAGDTDLALSYVDEAEKADCEHNEGRRRNDYELRRGQVLAKRGDAASANDVFDRLIQRSPDELPYRGAAAESMLSMKQGALALRFAEEGLRKAREKNNRDSEQYFMELAAAARKQSG